MEQQPRMVPLGEGLDLDSEPAHRQNRSAQGEPQQARGEPGGAAAAQRSARRSAAAPPPGVPNHLLMARDPRQLARYFHEVIEANRSPEAPPYTMVLFADPDNPRPDELVRAFATLPGRAEWFAAMALTFKSDTERLEGQFDRRRAEVRRAFRERWQQQVEADRQRLQERLQAELREQLQDSSERVRLAALTMIKKQLELFVQQQKPPTESDYRDAVAMDEQCQRLHEELCEVRELQDWMTHYAKYQQQLAISAHGTKGFISPDFGRYTDNGSARNSNLPDHARR